MIKGDLSNELATKVAIRFEAVIYNFGKVNKEGEAFVESCMNKGFNVLLVTLLPERKAMAWCYKWCVPYTQLVQASSTLEIPEILHYHHVVAYFDTDERLLAEVAMRGNPQIEAMKWEQTGGFSPQPSY